MISAIRESEDAWPEKEPRGEVGETFISFRVSPDLKAKLDRITKSTGAKRSQIIRQLIREAGEEYGRD